MCGGQGSTLSLSPQETVTLFWGKAFLMGLEVSEEVGWPAGDTREPQASASQALGLQHVPLPQALFGEMFCIFIFLLFVHTLRGPLCTCGNERKISRNQLFPSLPQFTPQEPKSGYWAKGKHCHPRATSGPAPVLLLSSKHQAQGHKFLWQALP